MGNCFCLFSGDLRLGMLNSCSEPDYLKRIYTSNLSLSAVMFAIGDFQFLFSFFLHPLMDAGRLTAMRIAQGLCLLSLLYVKGPVSIEIG